MVSLSFSLACLEEFEFCWQATKNKGSKRTTNKNSFFLIFIKSLSCIHIFCLQSQEIRECSLCFFDD